MTTNNFDKSSTGVDIEFSGCYDTDNSQHEFNENFKILQHSGYRTTSVLFYINYGNVSDNTSIEFTLKGKREALVKYLLAYADLTKSEIRNLSKAELLEEASDLMDSFDILTYVEENKDLEDYNLEIVPNKKLVTVSSRGYSQGDYSEIIYCPQDLEEAWGNKVDENDLSKTFDNLCWDAPVRATITINGDEYNYWDAPESDTYEWKREEFLTYVAKEADIDIQLLEDLVPTELKYL